jgi:two-component system, LytTR family, response regulator LytT
MNPLKVLIAEDEPGAAVNLTLALKEIKPETVIVATLPSNDELLRWLSENHPPDLGFFDIQLQNGLSFEVLKKSTSLFPIIFTTAYNQYALDAFKVNTIDYLLKPVKESDLRRSLNKYTYLYGQADNSSSSSESSVILRNEPEVGTFLVHQKNKLVPLPVEAIALLTIHNMTVYAKTFDSQSYPMNHTLDELEQLVSTKLFFRVNRQCIINRYAIKDMESYFNGRLLVNTTVRWVESIIVSKARVPVLKEWITVR